MNFLHAVALYVKTFLFASTTSPDVSFNTRMKALLHKHNSRSAHPFKAFVVSLSSKTVLKRMRMTSQKHIHGLLVDTAKYLIERYNPHLTYVCNNEMHFVFMYEDYQSHPFDGNFNKIISSMTGSATYFFTVVDAVLNENDASFSCDPGFTAKVVEFENDYDTLNYLVYRQNFCYNNNCLAHVSLLEKDDLKDDTAVLPDWFKHGTIIKKELVVKAVNPPHNNPPNAEDVFVRKQLREMSCRLLSLGGSFREVYERFFMERYLHSDEDAETLAALLY
jgi:hypothetical protein